MRRTQRSSATAGLALAILFAALGLLAFAGAASARTQVLLVGTFHGVKGGFSTLEAAVKAAKPGAWILVAPGDYKDRGTHVPPGAKTEDMAGAQVLIRTNGLHIRGLNRNRAVIDGTAPGSPQCGRSGKAQVFGPKDQAGKRSGRSGILVYKARNVTVENLTICNFLTGDLGGGNEIWWDGGAGTATQTDMGAWRGAYLTATSYFYAGRSAPTATYGIYSSNTKIGRGTLSRDYATNMSDSGYYVGACPDCNVTLDHVRGAYNALGYSGSDSGGNLVIENSEFDHNADGFDTNSENNNDAPPPQDGTCPNGGTGPQPPGTQQTHSCWVFMGNYVHDNNNANVPSTGVASSTPVGTGLSLSGARNDIVTANRFVNNGAWGALMLPFPDFGTPPPIAHCQGGTMLIVLGMSVCNFDAFGNEVAGNTFTHNGFFGNPTNGDLAEVSGQNNPGNCWHGNTDTAGAVTTDPPNLQSTHAQCGVPNSANGLSLLENLSSPLGAQLLCNTQLLAPCAATPTMQYPRFTSAPMPAVPHQATMPDPCRGVPANPWCGSAAKRPASTKQPAKVPHFTG